MSWTLHHPHCRFLDHQAYLADEDYDSYFETFDLKVNDVVAVGAAGYLVVVAAVAAEPFLAKPVSGMRIVSNLK